MDTANNKNPKATAPYQSGIVGVMAVGEAVGGTAPPAEPVDKFCKDCRHSSDDGSGLGRLQCDAPQNFVVHFSREAYLVTGVHEQAKRIRRCPSCATLRAATDALDICGPHGRWFEQKGSAS